MQPWPGSAVLAADEQTGMQNSTTEPHEKSWTHSHISMHSFHTALVYLLCFVLVWSKAQWQDKDQEHDCKSDTHCTHLALGQAAWPWWRTRVDAAACLQRWVRHLHCPSTISTTDTAVAGHVHC